MIQKILTYAYIFLGIASFCYWISALLAVFRMLKHRLPGRSLLSVATTGVFNEANFTDEGNHQRRKLVHAMTRFMTIIIGMVVVVFLGIQTQG